MRGPAGSPLTSFTTAMTVSSVSVFTTSGSTATVQVPSPFDCTVVLAPPTVMVGASPSRANEPPAADTRSSRTSSSQTHDSPVIVTLGVS